MITATLYNPQQAHTVIDAAWREVKSLLMAGHRLELEIRKEKRTSEQNKKLWAMLGDVSGQVDWHGQRLDPEDWKHVFSAALKRQRVVPGIEGGFVVLAIHTSKMSKAEMSDMIELMHAFGADRGVRWSAPETEDTP